MPFFGLLSFLRKGLIVGYNEKEMCQCPSSGFSHFYAAPKDVAGIIIGCVNALLRASLISTMVSLKWEIGQ